MSIKVKKRNAQPISHLLGKSGASRQHGEGLGPLLGKANAIARAQAQLEQHLPGELEGHVLVGGYSNGRLTILTDRAVWLTWLRFERARLLSLVRYLPELAGVTTLDFKVRPLRPTQAAVRVPRYLSTTAASHISECADYTEDPSLRAALQRLAAHAQPEQPGEDSADT